MVVIPLGLGSRKFGDHLPRFLASYAGDTLWALMVFLGLGLLNPAWPLRNRIIGALTFSFAIELIQLYQAPWIEAWRNTTLGALVLGFDFLWSDLLCYTVGVLIGAAAEYWICRQIGLHRISATT